MRYVLPIAVVLAACSPHEVTENPAPPIELPARYDTVRDEMLRQIERRFGG